MTGTGMDLMWGEGGNYGMGMNASVLDSVGALQLQMD